MSNKKKQQMPEFPISVLSDTNSSLGLIQIWSLCGH